MRLIPSFCALACASALPLAAPAQTAGEKSTLVEIPGSGMETGNVSDVGWQITEGGCLQFLVTDKAQVNLSGKHIKVVSSETEGDYATVLASGRDGTASANTPFVFSDATVLSGSGRFAFVGTVGDGGTRMGVTLSSVNASDFSGEIFVVNTWNRPCDVTVSGTNLTKVILGLPTAYLGSNPDTGTLVASDKVIVEGDTTLAGVLASREDGTDAIVRSGSVAPTLTLNVAEGSRPSFTGTFGTADARLSLVKAGAGTQTLGAASVQNLTLSGGMLALQRPSSIVGNIYVTVENNSAVGQLSLGTEATLTLNKDVALYVTDTSLVGEALPEDLASYVDNLKLFAGEATDRSVVAEGLVTLYINGQDTEKKISVAEDGTLRLPGILIDMSTESLPVVKETILGETTVAVDGEVCSRPVSVLKTKTADVQIFEVMNGRWEVTGPDADGYYTHTLIPTSTELPEATQNISFDAETWKNNFNGGKEVTYTKAVLPGLTRALQLTDGGVPWDDDSGMGGTESWTVALYVRPSNAEKECVVWSYGTSSDGFLALSWGSDGSASEGKTFKVVQRTGGSGNVTSLVVGPANLSSDKWHLVAVTYDALLKKVYLTVDDAENEKSAVIESCPLKAQFQFGNVHGASSTDDSARGGLKRGLNLMLDEFRAWKSPLTLGQLDTYLGAVKGMWYAIIDDTPSTSELTLSKFGSETDSCTLQALSAEKGPACLNILADITQSVTLGANLFVGVKLWGEGTFEILEGEQAFVIPSVEIKDDTATLLLHRSQSDVVGERVGTVGTFAFSGGTEDAPLVVELSSTSTDAYAGKLHVKDNTWLKVHQADTSNVNKVYALSGEGPGSKVYLTSVAGWGMSDTDNSFIRNVALIVPSENGSNKFWIRTTKIGEGVSLKIEQGTFVKAEGSGPLNLTELTGSGTYEMSSLGLILTASESFTLPFISNEGASTLMIKSSASSGASSAPVITSTQSLPANLGAITVGDESGHPVTFALSGANGNYRSMITVMANATLENAGTNKIPFGKGSIVNNGTVLVSAGTEGALPSISGSGNLDIASNAYLAGTFTATGTLRVYEGKTLSLSDSSDDFRDIPSIEGPSIVIENGASIHIADSDAKVIIPEGKVLTFASGAILDASAVPDVLGSLVMPTLGSVTVKGTENADPGTVLLKKADPTPAEAQKFVVTGVDNAYVTTSSEGFVLGKMTAGEGDTLPDATTSPNLAAAVQQAAAASGATSVTVAYGQSGGVQLDAATAEAGATLFTGITTTTTEASTTTVTVAYDFGITGITVGDFDDDGIADDIQVTAKVQNMSADGTANLAAFASDTTVTLCKDGAETGVTGTIGNDGTVTFTLSDGLSGIDDNTAAKFTVKAEKATP